MAENVAWRGARYCQ